MRNSFKVYYYIRIIFFLEQQVEVSNIEEENSFQASVHALNNLKSLLSETFLDEIENKVRSKSSTIHSEFTHILNTHEVKSSPPPVVDRKPKIESLGPVGNQVEGELERVL